MKLKLSLTVLLTLALAGILAAKVALVLSNVNLWLMLTLGVTCFVAAVATLIITRRKDSNAKFTAFVGAYFGATLSGMTIFVSGLALTGIFTLLLA